MFLPIKKEKILGLSLVLIILSVLIVLILEFLKNPEEFRKGEEFRNFELELKEMEWKQWRNSLPDSQKNVFSEKQYNNSTNVRVIEQESEENDLTIQIKGIVKEFNEEELVVVAVDKTYVIGLLKQNSIYCVPEMMPRADGKGMASTQDAMLDFSRVRDETDVLSVGEIQKQIEVGDDVLVEVEVNEKGEMIVKMIVGFGCEIERKLGL